VSIRIRALAFKWIRILFRCWKDCKPYDELTYQRALAARRPKPKAAEAVELQWKSVAGFNKITIAQLDGTTQMSPLRQRTMSERAPKIGSANSILWKSPNRYAAENAVRPEPKSLMLVPFTVFRSG
jgi:hypothetical protein